eukprot:2120330-Rhodomonas_salina.1
MGLATSVATSARAERSALADCVDRSNAILCPRSRCVGAWKHASKCGRRMRPGSVACCPPGCWRVSSTLP